MSRWRVAALFLLVGTLAGLLSASIIITTNWADGRSSTIAVPLLMELTGAYTFLLLVPVILAAVRAFPVTRANWWHRVPLHAAISVGVGVAHTLLMWGTRTVAYWMLDWGAYDYGVMRFRFLMEYQKQFLSYWLVVVIASGLAFARRARERELQAVELKTQLAEARLNMLKAQLKPHFLFNTLNMISSLVYVKPDRADTMIANLSDLLRQSLRYSDTQEVTVEQELESLRAYLEIAQARFDDRLTIDVEAPPAVRAALVPHLILQPLVENAIVHGTSRSTASGWIRIAVERKGERLRLTVDDNGPGFPVPLPEPGAGLGLSGTAERLEAHYGSRQRLELSNRAGAGAHVAIELPWRIAGAPTTPASSIGAGAS